MESKKGKIYIVATPIGNLEDITLRAIRILKEVDLIAAEDTRHTLKLLNYFNISKPMISYYRHNENERKYDLIEKLENGENIALVSDAGTPGISDPGEEIIKECIKRKIEIIPLPGACASINALICSGLDTSQFTFIGFLPTNKKNRDVKMKEIEESSNTIILYESPHKIKTTLKDLSFLANRKVVLSREITKIHEEFLRGTVDELLQNSDNLKGEIVIVIEKNNNKKQKKLKELSTKDLYNIYEKEGLDKKEIIKKIAKDKNVSKNIIYQEFLKN